MATLACIAIPLTVVELKRIGAAVRGGLLLGSKLQQHSYTYGQEHVRLCNLQIELVVWVNTSDWTDGVCVA